MNRYKDKTALITGAGKRNGIGFGIASKLAAGGANIVLTDLASTPDKVSPVKLGSLEEMQSLASELASEYGVEALALPMDVADMDSIEKAMGEVKEKFGRLDYLFNNAGTAVGAPQATHKYDEGAWIKTIDINLHGVFRVSKAAVEIMQGGPGSIVNIASKAGKSPAPLNGAYAASKAGVIMVTKVMAMELAKENIRVNAVCPGLIMTDLQVGNIALKAHFFETSVEEAEKRMCESVPLGRMGTIDEVADLCSFLASDESSYITGQAINIGGGLLMEA